MEVMVSLREIQFSAVRDWVVRGGVFFKWYVFYLLSSCVTEVKVISFEEIIET